MHQPQDALDYDAAIPSGNQSTTLDQIVAAQDSSDLRRNSATKGMVLGAACTSSCFSVFFLAHPGAHFASQHIQAHQPNHKLTSAAILHVAAAERF